MSWKVAVSTLLVLFASFASSPISAPGQEESLIGVMFGEWHMSCSLNRSAGTKSCSIWAGPVAATSAFGGSARFTLLIDPETPYATIASEGAMFVKMQIDHNNALLVDCTTLGMCELSRGQARELVKEASHGENLQVQLALPNGTYGSLLFLTEYRAAFADFLEEERLYELKSVSGSKSALDNVLR